MFILSNFYDDISIDITYLNPTWNKKNQTIFFKIMNRKKIPLCKPPIIREIIICYCITNLSRTHHD